MNPPPPPPPPTTQPHPHSAFFYGTLMSPEILHRVCHGNTNPTNPIYATHQLRIQPAILPHHRRHRVRGADYPAIVPHEGSAVRGTYVTGLTDADVWRLDVFEGAEYVRRKARARVLVPGEGEGEVEVEGEEVEAETYVWVADVAELEDREWDFEEFRREKMGFWVGEGGAGEYADVDRAVTEAEGRDGTRGRGANGHISQALQQAHRA